MGRTAYEKIVSNHLRNILSDGSLVIGTDKVFCHEITTPPHIREAEKLGNDVVFDPNRVFAMIDHVSPAKDEKTALQGKIMRDWSKKHDLKFFDVGMRHGVCHALIPEIPLVFPGETAVMGDSHTGTSSALCALTLGIGTTDLGNAIRCGFVVIRPQKVVRVNFIGKLPANVYAKDAVLALLKKLGKTGAKNCVLEFHGVFDTMAERLTISNQTVEGGATTGMWMVDEVTVKYLWPAIGNNYNDDVHPSQALADFEKWNSDPDCVYYDEITIDVSVLKPLTTISTHPSNVVEVETLEGTKIDQVAICSCTNARLEDLRLAAAVMKKMGGKVKIRTIVIPATAHIQKQAIKEGLISIFLDANCSVESPSCGPCLGMSCGVLTEGEVCLATTNRNYKDRMGEGGFVHLSSPVVAAYSAMKGVISVPSVEFCEGINASISKDDVAAPLDEIISVKPIPKIDYRVLIKSLSEVSSSRIFSGKPFFLKKEKVNTDEIIRARHLTEVDKEAFGAYCLESIVKDPAERKELRFSQIIVSDIGFGDGSSREQAPWALEGIGITCVIAKSFERIFEANFFNNACLAITLPANIVDEIFEDKPDNIKVIWDTDENLPSYVEWDRRIVEFNISEFQKDIIRKGGSTGLMLELAAELQEEGKI
jgi:3-isopropylmalate/(R)-2-methylmalate dehydratase large subunit